MESGPSETCPKYLYYLSRSQDLDLQRQILILILLSLSMISLNNLGIVRATQGSKDTTWAPYGPLVSKLQFNMYAGSGPMINDFKAGNLDLTDTLSPSSSSPFKTQCGSMDNPQWVLSPNTLGSTEPFTCASRDVGGLVSPFTDGLVYQAGKGYSNFWTALNGREVSGGTDTLRWGQKTPTFSLNPFAGGSSANPTTANTELNIMGEIYDTIVQVNPQDSGQVFCWMCNSYSLDSNSQTMTFELRQDLRWQDGAVLDSRDVKFSLLNLDHFAVNYAGFNAAVYPYLVGVSLISSTRFSLTYGPGSPTLDQLLSDLASVPIMPQHLWVDPTQASFFGCDQTQQGPLCVGRVSEAELSPDFEALSHGLLIGSGPFMCTSQFATDMGRLGTGCGVQPDGTRSGDAVYADGKVILQAFDRTSEPSNTDPFLQYMRSYNPAWGTSAGTAAFSGLFQEWSWADRYNEGTVTLRDLGDVANCYGYFGQGVLRFENLSPDPNVKNWQPGDPVVFDNDSDTAYTYDFVHMTGDTVINPYSQNLVPNTGIVLSTYSYLSFDDTNHNGVWDQGEPVVYDANPNGIYDDHNQDTIIPYQNSQSPSINDPLVHSLACSSFRYNYWLKQAFHPAGNVPPIPISSEVALVASHFDDTWVYPFSWQSLTNIVQFTP